ncbi:uncharacterized protein MONBRDRAFT_34093 [Monosiga brevicollis MX1]|uniref:K Homology domain-containing protein n=1 Tax=Monosiga brevicollis TaxID=81824 RepID=A9V9F1_MONBE|nr:uncharacterized protein MONBRDRAFT_34093 [Monosiga brevicollis MX1]EDQ85849.1 predicted protein [Monosiga brevicollis MX1]|eukprot:XP_001749328.1 hypothetical protein [Monosiga brevicollis MX1]
MSDADTGEPPAKKNFADALAKAKAIAEKIKGKRQSVDGAPTGMGMGMGMGVGMGVGMGMAPVSAMAVGGVAAPPAIHHVVWNEPLELKDVDASSIVTVEMTVPGAHVGRIIGRGGETINRLQNQSGSRIQVAQDLGQPMRPCTLTGVPDSVQRAKVLIEEIVREHMQPFGPGAGGPGGNASGPTTASLMASAYGTAPDGDGADPNANAETETMMVPAERAGFLIGRGGETINMIQTRSGARLKMVQEDPHAAERLLYMMGDAEAIKRARELVADLLAEKPSAPQEAPPMPTSYDENNRHLRLKIEVPGVAAGRVIGRGGETIRRIEADTGCRIQFDQADGVGLGPNDARIATLTGNQDAIEAAEQAIVGIIRDAERPDAGPPSRRADSRPTDTIAIPAERAGFIIGKGGETIRSIQDQTGVHLELDRNSEAGNEKIFIIRGNPDQIEHCKMVIRDMLARRESGPGGPRGGPHRSSYGGPPPGYFPPGGPPPGPGGYPGYNMYPGPPRPGFGGPPPPGGPGGAPPPPSSGGPPTEGAAPADQATAAPGAHSEASSNTAAAQQQPPPPQQQYHQHPPPQQNYPSHYQQPPPQQYGYQAQPQYGAPAPGYPTHEQYMQYKDWYNAQGYYGVPPTGYAAPQAATATTTVDANAAAAAAAAWAAQRQAQQQAQAQAQQQSQPPASDAAGSSASA